MAISILKLHYMESIWWWWPISFCLGLPLPPLSPFPCNICSIICLPGCSDKCCKRNKNKRKSSQTKKNKKHSMKSIKTKHEGNHANDLVAPTMPLLPLSRFVVRPTMPAPPIICCDADHPVILNCDIPPCQPTNCIYCYNPSPPNVLLPVNPA